MPKVKLKTIYASPRYGCAGPGDELTVDAKSAKELVAGGYADAVESAPAPKAAAVEPKPEVAAVEPPTEKAVRPKPKPRRRASTSRRLRK